MNWPEAIFLIFTVPAFLFTGLVILAMFLDVLEALYNNIRNELFWSGFMRDIAKMKKEHYEEMMRRRKA